MSISESTKTIPDFLLGGGELGERIRCYEWSGTSLGPVTQWPQSLQTCVRIMLSSRQPIWIGWGPELIKLYNDPYKAIVGGKHPWALGRPASEVWREIWDDIAPMLNTVMEKDQGTYVESQLLIMERNGYPEETYYTFSYTPIPGDDGRPAGMICANTDDTERIISERQLRTLTRLGKLLTDTKTSKEVVAQTLEALAVNPQDFPFSAYYEWNEGAARCMKLSEAELPLPTEVQPGTGTPFSAVFAEAAKLRQLQVIEAGLLGFTLQPGGAWGVAPHKVAVLPVLSPGREPYGFIVFGINPYRLVDENYSSFFTLLADQVATSFAGVHSMEEERKRAEALADIDRAKTTFFSNISHEFRTPLTLLLGPVEDALNDPYTIPANRERMDVAYRNGLRLQKLVNTLLEFSRIEAGRLEGSYSKVDIVSYTCDLASTFRSAIEKAGMELRFETSPVAGDVYVDTEMWERIVLNLVSNAFKYSEQGAITVGVHGEGDNAVISVVDTGIGIPEDQLSKVFDRFHRIESRGGRSQEGTGIGLAMVRELVRLHGGRIEVKSKQGEGSCFTVYIPVGSEHLPQERIVATAAAATKGHDVLLQEALKWLPEVQDAARGIGIQPVHDDGSRRTVLLADDNTDMRDYVGRLLSASYRVLTARDGEEAYQLLIKEQPDLLLTDIMMPRLDGFGLLKKVRQHPLLRNTPVIFLSARAGEEAKVEGLDAGADDYLVKPFSARELMARVDGNIKIAESRRNAERNLRQVIQQAPVAMNIFRGPDFRIDLANGRALEIWDKKPEDVLQKTAEEVFPELIREHGFGDILSRVYTTGEPFVAIEMPVALLRSGKTETLFLNFIYEPLRDVRGTVEGIVGVGIDVTDSVRARKRLEENEQYLEAEVARRTQELKALNADLQQSNQDLQQFAHVASHDLKEPLRKVKTFLSRFADDPETHFSERGQGFLQKVNSAADRMYAMIEGVLNYSMLNAAGQPIERVDLNNVMRQIEQDLELPITQKNAVIRYKNLPEIEGASVLLYQLFYNLLNNALKFARPDGAAEVTIDAQQCAEGIVEIRFSDNGIGFSPAQAERIFDPFTRLHPKDKYEGTGLGLSLCRRIVQRHNGSIQAFGKEGQGAEFVIRLPLKHTGGSL
ncbi:MAG: response regulator [Chitinophagaceae bacterium]|nr:MAG: response regulator [Chitinophagaceae bacterium]